MLSIKGRMILSIFALLVVAGCQSTKKVGTPPPNYMAEVDRIFVTFDNLARNWDQIGDGLISIEKERFVLTPSSTDGLSDGDATDRIDLLMDNLFDIKQDINSSGKAFLNNTKIPKNKDRDGVAIYEAHNDAMENLFIALLGEDDDEVRLVSPYDGSTVNVTTQTDKQERRFRIDELTSKGVIVLPDYENKRELGFLAALDNYLQVHKQRLNGRREVTVCQLEKDGDKEFSCVAKNRQIMFGSGKSLLQSMWSDLYENGKEKLVVVAMKEVIRTRGRISVFLSQSN